MIILQHKLLVLLTLLLSLLLQSQAVNKAKPLLGAFPVPIIKTVVPPANAPASVAYTSSTYLGGGHISCKKPIWVESSCAPNSGYIAWNARSHNADATTTLTFELYNSGKVAQLASSVCAFGGDVCTVQGITVSASGQFVVPDCGVATSNSCR